MTEEFDIKAMSDIVRSLRQDTEKLKEIGAGMPVVQKNADRILADIRMLEININDVVEIVN
ncbi:MAG: hypothetical protein PVG61_00210 [Dehalococcoidia bacterium]|jgi:hypothetical protein